MPTWTKQRGTTRRPELMWRSFECAGQYRSNQSNIIRHFFLARSDTVRKKTSTTINKAVLLLGEWQSLISSGIYLNRNTNKLNVKNVQKFYYEKEVTVYVIICIIRNIRWKVETSYLKIKCKYVFHNVYTR